MRKKKKEGKKEREERGGERGARENDMLKEKEKNK